MYFRFFPLNYILILETSVENIFGFNIDRNWIYKIFDSRKRRFFYFYEGLWNECSKHANRTASVIWRVFQVLQEWRKWRRHINFVYTTDYHILDQNVLTLLNRKQRFLFIYYFISLRMFLMQKQKECAMRSTSTSMFFSDWLNLLHWIRKHFWNVRRQYYLE